MDHSDPGKLSTLNKLLCAVRLHIKLLDVVALIEDMPEKGLLRGQVGTLVEQLSPEVFEVEFADNGRTYALTAIAKTRLMLLPYQQVDKAA